MGLHVIPLVIGAAVGSAATYLYRDKAARERMLDMVGAVSARLAALRPRREPLQEAIEEAVEVSEESVEAAEEAVERAVEHVEEAVEEIAAEPEVREPDSNSTSVH